MMTNFGEFKMKRFSLGLALCAAITLTSCASLLPNSDFNTALVAGDAAMESADWEKAATKYEEASALQPDNLDVKLKQAMAYQRGGKLAKAYNLYQIIIDSGKGKGDIEAVKTAKMNQAKFGFDAKNSKDNADADAKDAGAQEPVSFYASNPTVAVEEPGTTTPLALPEPLAVTEQPAPEKQTVPADDVKALLLVKVNDWAKAWQGKDLNSYYAHYTNDFAGEFADNKAWRNARAKKIKAGKTLKVEVADIEVLSADANSAKVSFTQNYQSNLYKDTGKKTMELKLVDGRWLITNEQFTKQ